MPRIASNQWEFDDLFKPTSSKPPAASSSSSLSSPPAAQKREVLSVSELTGRIRSRLEAGFPSVWVSGEVSNLRVQPSGHAYFTLKDAGSQLSCVLFRGQASADRSSLRDGLEVTLSGEITVYEPRGQYQLRVAQLELKGAGALQAAFERLKARLAAEGLFASERKRPVPKLPRTVGIVTSASTAALRDVLHVIGRRHRGLELVLSPCRVQGDGAAAEIVAAIEALNRWSGEKGAVDVILLTRGGGSIEDLWCFNEEAVARAIAASRIPVVSAVGHEIDFTIADFAADLRAATPSAGAEILTQGYVDAEERIAQWTVRMRLSAEDALTEAAGRFDDRWQRLMRAHPRRTLEAGGQRLDELVDSLSRLAAGRWRSIVADSARIARRFTALRPAARIAESRDDLGAMERRFAAAKAAGLRGKADEFRRLAEKLAILSPKKTLGRGYSITRDAATGSILRNPADAPAGTRLRTSLADGELFSTAEGRPG
jgi:exodeoxyribonuclease VII large subunit